MLVTEHCTPVCSSAHELYLTLTKGASQDMYRSIQRSDAALCINSSLLDEDNSSGMAIAALAFTALQMLQIDQRTRKHSLIVVCASVSCFVGIRTAWCHVSTRCLIPVDSLNMPHFGTHFVFAGALNSHCQTKAASNICKLIRTSTGSSRACLLR